MFNTSLLKEGHGLGEITQRQIAETRQLISEKWEPYKLLDGIKGVLKENVATLLENQANYMLTEGANSTSAGSFEAMAFPMIRRTFQRLVANDLVSVQSLVQPIGRVYFYNPKISKRTAATTDANGITSTGHTSMPGIQSNEAAKFTVDVNGRKVLSPEDYGKVVPVAGATGITEYEQASLFDRFYATEYDAYGESLFDRTRGRSIQVIKTVTITNYVPGTSKVLVAVTGFTQPTTGRLRGPMGQLADTEEFLTSLRIVSGEDLRIAGDATNKVVRKADTDTLRSNLPAQKYGKAIVDVNGNIAIEVDLTVIDSNGQYVALAPLTTGGADLTLKAIYLTYQDMEGESEQAELNIDLDFVNIAVGPDRMLRTTYTPQLKQDVHAFHSIDIEAEFTALMSEVMSGEIDREILRDLQIGAAHTATWNYGLFETMRTNVANSGGVMAITKKEYSQELVMVINEVSAQIQKSTMSKGASWLVVSPEISALFYNLENFHVTSDGPEDSEYSMGIDKVGSLNGRYKVYVDTQAPAGLLLMGNKGDSVFKSGYLYCPYVPLMLFPAIQSPTDRRTVMHVMTRYGKKLVNNRYFGKVYVDGLRSLNVSRFVGAI
jgi:hypothetical protein